MSGDLPGQTIADALAEIGHIVRYPRGAIVITEGDVSDSIFVVMSGKLKVYVSDANGREVVLAEYGPGDYVGELALDQGRRSASVSTLEPSTLSCVTRDAFRDFLATRQDAALDLVLRLIGRVRASTQGVRSLALMDVYGRVARLLLDLAVKQDGHLVVTERLTQQQIAERVGCSREMVSRIFSDLQKGGYIRLVDRRIHIERRLPPRH